MTFDTNTVDLACDINEYRYFPRILRMEQVGVIQTDAREHQQPFNVILTPHSLYKIDFK